MQINHPKYNQRRVSVIKFLGELYNYRMVESSVIFKTLYSFIRFGVTLDGMSAHIGRQMWCLNINILPTKMTIFWISTHELAVNSQANILEYLFSPHFCP